MNPSRRAVIIALSVKRVLTALAEKGIRTVADILPVTLEVRTAIWEKFIKRTDPHIIGMKKAMAALFKKQFAEVIENVRRNPPPKAWTGQRKEALTAEQQRFVKLWLFDKTEWRKNFMRSGQPWIQGTYEDAGKTALEDLGIDEVFVVDAATQRYIKAHVFTFAKEIGDTTAKMLTAQFEDALKNGESVLKVIKRVKTVMTDATDYRAQMIAQTEMIGASNKGAYDGKVQSGVVWGNQWIGALDERIREDHEWLTVEGIAIPLGETFPRVNIQYPGEYGGDPSTVINCRCTLKGLTRGPNGERPGE